MAGMHGARREFALLGLLALLWGTSYPLLKIAVAEIPPVTLIALRVTGAALFLGGVMALRGDRLPRDVPTWRLLFLQSFFNSIGPWVLLAWGQQFVDAALSSVLNSTSPIFVFLFTALLMRHEALHVRQICGAIMGLCGVVLIVGVDALQGVGKDSAGEIACLVGAALYGIAAIHGKRFNHISALATATGTMIWAAVVLVPAASLLDQPWRLTPSAPALAATASLSLASTGIALLIYFRLVRTIGSMGVASQAYLRAGVGVMLGITFLGEALSPVTGAGLLAAVLGVTLINWPVGRTRSGKAAS